MSSRHPAIFQPGCFLCHPRGSAQRLRAGRASAWLLPNPLLASETCRLQGGGQRALSNTEPLGGRDSHPRVAQ